MNDYYSMLASGSVYKTIVTLSGKKHSVHINSIVGYCQNSIHEGYITASLMKSHRCREKKCKHFVKLEELPYWNKEYRKCLEKTYENCQRKKERHNPDILPDYSWYSYYR